MCGIAGVVYREPATDDLPAQLRLMQAALRHRGPDDRGIYISPDRRAGFAHTRLAILDLSAAGHQPMASSDGRFHVTFNGEIYNFRELRNELETAGEMFQTQTDTELLLRMYERFGPSGVREFAGMFAFAIWDEREKSCFLARSPMGVKPLYYCERNGQLAFASELRALLAAGLAPRRLSRAALQGYLLFGSVQEPHTIIDGVSELPAGSWLSWRDGRSQQRRYFEIQFRPDAPDKSDAVAAARAGLEESVRRHFVSDTPVGIFLSGGVDSTAILAVARHVGVTNIHTFSISFDSPAYNEGDVAARTAKHFQTEHHDWRLHSPEGTRLLNDFVAHLDQPSVDGFNTYCVSKWAHECGMKVVLSGLGGDEFFGGYPSFQLAPRLAAFRRCLTLLGPARKPAGVLLESFAASPRARRFASFIASHGGIGSAYWTIRGIFTPIEAHRLMKCYLDDNTSGTDEEAMYFTAAAQPTSEDMVSWLEITRYMRNQLLRDSDVMSMAWGLELRVPFVDDRLSETLVNIPASVRLRRGKQFLLEMVPEIPEWVAQRPKQGFTFPFADWMQDEWREIFAQLDTLSPVTLKTWYRRWTLFALEDFLGRNRIDCPRLKAA